ncbi:MAG: ferredoxin family protein [Chloroflexi bacterium]|nr:ferredoxin family protein [Chloroflexota bacterium]
MISAIDSRICIGCGLCEKFCSADVIRMHPETGKAVLAYPRDCWTCYTCELDCPVGAITVLPFRKSKPVMWRQSTKFEEAGK